MCNTEDTKSPIEALEEAAGALEREAKALNGNAIGSIEAVKNAAALNPTAVGLKRIAEGLRWIAGPLEWIAEPLERTGEALMKLTPADIAEVSEAVQDENVNALDKAANALDETAGALECCLLSRIIPMPNESLKKLERIEKALKVEPGTLYRVIPDYLNRVAHAVGAPKPETLKAAAAHLDEVATAIEKAKADETDSST